MGLAVGRLPTCAEYFKEEIRPNVDLALTPKQCCPFHQEDTPSFSYMPTKDRWSCFGACHTYNADVITMHQMNYRYRTREEAEQSLRQKCRCPKPTNLNLIKPQIRHIEEDIEQKELIQKAIIMATTVDRFIELDYVMSKYPISTNDLHQLIRRWSNG